MVRFKDNRLTPDRSLVAFNADFFGDFLGDFIFGVNFEVLGGTFGLTQNDVSESRASDK